MAKPVQGEPVKMSIWFKGGSVVAALWGIFVWKEFKDAPKGTNMLLSLMFGCYLIGLVLIVYSRFA
ncbi:MAG: hypothetical protein WCS03_12510 [Bacteroidota bacterium]